MDELAIVVTGWYNGGIAYDVLHLSCAGGSVDLAGNGTTILDLAAWGPHIDSITASWGLQSTTKWDAWVTVGGVFRLRARLRCVDLDGTVTNEYKYYDYSGGANAQCSGARSQISGSQLWAVWWHSSPMADCTSLTVAASGGFAAPIGGAVKGSGPGEGGPEPTWCICASGGTGYYHTDTGSTDAPQYKFSIVSGNLASGQKLDPDTGCVTGTADGLEGASDDITFQVLDVLSGNTAQVTCGILTPGCTGSVVNPAGNWFL